MIARRTAARPRCRRSPDHVAHQVGPIRFRRLRSRGVRRRCRIIRSGMLTAEEEALSSTKFCLGAQLDRLFGTATFSVGSESALDAHAHRLVESVGAFVAAKRAAAGEDDGPGASTRTTAAATRSRLGNLPVADVRARRPRPARVGQVGPRLSHRPRPSLLGEQVLQGLPTAPGCRPRRRSTRATSGGAGSRVVRRSMGTSTGCCMASATVVRVVQPRRSSLLQKPTGRARVPRSTGRRRSGACDQGEQAQGRPLTMRRRTATGTAGSRAWVHRHRPGRGHPRVRPAVGDRGRPWTRTSGR